MTRYRALDALRGVAALSVVLFHWKHFWYVAGRLPADFDSAVQPMYAVLWPLYDHGDRAVDLFFVLSGFIFFGKYRSAIVDRGISASSFAWLRFSRLYPLHLLTLLAVLGLQWGYRGTHGYDFVYQPNTASNFALHLGLASNWLPRAQASFNGPIWSVSVEVVLYASFFVACRLQIAGRWHCAGIAAFGLLVFALSGYGVAQGLGCFYLGGLLFQLRARLEQHERFLLLISAIALAVAIFALAQVQMPSDSVWPLYFGITMGVFPPLVLGLAAVERFIPDVEFSVLGELSYSSYLLHFPMQLIFVMLAPGWGWSFTSPLTLLVFLAILILLSILTYRVFERPAQNWLRQRGGSALARA